MGVIRENLVGNRIHEIAILILCEIQLDQVTRFEWVSVDWILAMLL